MTLLVTQITVRKAPYTAVQVDVQKGVDLSIGIV